MSKKLVTNSVFYDFESSDGKTKHNNLSGRDVYYAAMKFGDSYYSVKFKFDILKKDASATYKDHQILNIQVDPVVDPAQITVKNNSAAFPARTKSTSYFTLD
jgi:hypothetical protein